MLKAFKLISVLTVILTITFIINSCAKGGSSGPIIHINCDSLFNDSITSADSAWGINIPNAFTPNGDGQHDQYNIHLNYIDSARITIFDDNNNVVYRYSGKSITWGRDTSVPQGKYYYRLQLKTRTGKRVGKCGFIWLLKCMPSNMTDSLDYLGYGYYNSPLNVDPIRVRPCN